MAGHIRVNIKADFYTLNLNDIELTFCLKLYYALKDYICSSQKLFRLEIKAGRLWVTDDLLPTCSQDGSCEAIQVNNRRKNKYNNSQNLHVSSNTIVFFNSIYLSSYCAQKLLTLSFLFTFHIRRTLMMNRFLASFIMDIIIDFSK